MVREESNQGRFKLIFLSSVTYLKIKLILLPQTLHDMAYCILMIMMITRLLSGISGCKESRVRQPGASGFWNRASEFGA